MEFVANVEEHTCPDGCEPSPAEILTAVKTGTSAHDVHQFNEVHYQSLLTTVLGDRG